MNSRIEYMCVNERVASGTVRVQRVDVERVHEFKYVGSTDQSIGECGKEVKKRLQPGWSRRRKISIMICDKRVTTKSERKSFSSG